MTSYDDREKEYYNVIAMPSVRALELVDHIIGALVQRRMRLPLLTIIHWLPDRWQCLTRLDDIERFHQLLDKDGARTTERIDRLDFSAALGDNERHYHRAVSLLDFLDTRLFCSYIVRTNATLQVAPDPADAGARGSGVLRALSAFFGVDDPTCAVREYRVVVDFPMTMSMRRESALQIAAATRYYEPPGQRTGTVSSRTGTGSRSESLNVNSTKSGHSLRDDISVSMSASATSVTFGSLPVSTPLSSSSPPPPSSSSSSSSLSSSSLDADSEEDEDEDIIISIDAPAPAAPAPIVKEKEKEAEEAMEPRLVVVGPAPLRGVIKLVPRQRRRDDSESSSHSRSNGPVSPKKSEIH